MGPPAGLGGASGGRGLLKAVVCEADESITGDQWEYQWKDQNYMGLISMMLWLVHEFHEGKTYRKPLVF